MVNQGIQLWTVPSTRPYQIIAAGASSAVYGGNTPGRGAVISTTTVLTAGQIVAILVGQNGQNGAGCGGGGGTFVATGAYPTLSSAAPLLVAGGGGGDQGGNGLDASLTTSGVNSGTAGGTGGQQGAYNTGYGGQVGSGFYNPATSYVSGNDWGYSGVGFIYGGYGGAGNGNGGFGGGGGNGNNSGSGGGGGYSGGGAQLNGPGGGGGSFDINGAGNNATRYLGSLPSSVSGQVSAGYNTGNGFVVVI